MLTTTHRFPCFLCALIDYLRSYDLSGHGNLCFEDTLTLLAQYHKSMPQKQLELRKALDTLALQAESPLGFSLKELKTMLTTDLHDGTALTDREVDEILDDLAEDNSADFRVAHLNFERSVAMNRLSWPKPLPQLTNLEKPVSGSLRMRILSVSDLSHYGRCKRRGTQGVAFRTVDPMLTISCDDQIVYTTVLSHAFTPKWDQVSLRLPFDAPSDSLLETQRWIESNKLTFSLYDYQMGGVVPHIEWLASGSIPFSHALKSSIVAKVIPVTLHASHPAPIVTIQISLQCTSTECNPIVELFTQPEDIWLSGAFLYRHALFKDLQKVDTASDTALALQALTSPLMGAGGDAALKRRSILSLGASMIGSGGGGGGGGGDSNSNSSNSNDGNIDGSDNDDDDDDDDNDNKSSNKAAGITFVSHVVAFYKQWRSVFKRRVFRAVGLDEHNQFHCLPSFITPLTLPDTDVRWTPLSLARHIARIPTQPPDEDPLINPEYFSSNGGGNGKGDEDALLDLDSDDPFSHMHAGFQVCCPSTMVQRGHGSELEHAILLCGAILHLGINAFVCVGTDSLCTRYWVVLLPSCAAAEDNDGNNGSTSESKGGGGGGGGDSLRSPLYGTSTGGLFSPKTPRNHSSASDATGNSTSAYYASLKVELVTHFDATTGLMQRLGNIYDFKSQQAVPMTPSLSRRHAHRRNLSSGGTGSSSSSSQSNKKKKKQKHDPISVDDTRVAGTDMRDFASVAAVFNHENLWFNVQSADAIGTIKWDFDNTKHWATLIGAKELKREWPQLPFKCWYNPHCLQTMSRLPSHLFAIPDDMSKTITTRLVAEIQAYRRDKLYIPKTFFHRPLCIALGRLLDAGCFEERHIDGRGRRAWMAGKQVIDGNCLPRRNLTTMADAKQRLTMVQLIKAAALASLEEELEEEKTFISDGNYHLDDVPTVAECIPDHHLWYAKPFQFLTTNPVHIMTQLQRSGILNCSIPGVTYAISVRVIKYEWNIKRAWVFVGYLFDVNRTKV
jgi:hypothetical protein